MSLSKQSLPDVLVNSCEFMRSPEDRAALCIAAPRVGVLAQRKLPRCYIAKRKRCRFGKARHYCGERLVKIVWPDGYVAHYEGEAGAERKVCGVWPEGYVAHYEGAKGGEVLKEVKS